MRGVYRIICCWALLPSIFVIRVHSRVGMCPAHIYFVNLMMSVLAQTSHPSRPTSLERSLGSSWRRWPIWINPLVHLPNLYVGYLPLNDSQRRPGGNIPSGTEQWFLAQKLPVQPCAKCPSQYTVRHGPQEMWSPIKHHVNGLT